MPKDTRSHKGQGVSSYAHGANHAQRGRYGISGHRDDNINPSQYQSRSDPLEPGRGGSNIPLPGIGALHEQLRQDNEAPTSSRDTAGRVHDNQDFHRIEAQSKSLGYMLTLLITGQNSGVFPDRTSHGEQAPRDEHTSKRSSDYIRTGRESLALHSSRLSNTRGAENIDRRGERDTQGKNPVIREFEI